MRHVREFSRNFLNSIAESIEKVVMTLFEPYFGYQAEYPQLEKKYLSKDVQKLKPVCNCFYRGGNKLES
jgi:hypothetical protein